MIRTLILVTIVNFCISFSAIASPVEPVTIKHERSIYDLLAGLPGLQSKVVSMGLAFKFVPVIKNIVIRFADVTQNPEFPECSLVYTAEVAGLAPVIHMGEAPVLDMVKAPYRYGVVDASVTRSETGSCEQNQEKFIK